ATLFASLTKAIFGDGTLPKDKILIGAALGVLVIIIDSLFLKKKKFRLHLMPIAVGIYLPVTLATPMILGGLVQYFVQKKKGVIDEGKDQGILFSSGLVAGESLMGVAIALLITLGVNLSITGIPDTLVEIFSVAGMLGLTLMLRKKAML
ncbi:MAG: OPT/YSL family transporter, partial [Proteobacteria bacterium]|nr:OPT/YSL family transporter [Pseudomonadota bacterium]